MHKAGFVNIVGNPNVGKSTLMNKLVGEKISIITSKSQTTRHRIMGIVNDDDYQIVYSDTPGVLKPNYGLQESMLDFSKSALRDADVLLYVTDTVEKVDKNEDFLNSVRKLDIPILVIVNKIDLSDQKVLEEKVEYLHRLMPDSEIIPVSALRNFNVEIIFKKVLSLLPENPPYFDKESLTDKPARFFISEIIRQKILLYYQKEIPYSCEVVVESFKEEKKLVRITAIIYVEKDTQKGIIIGHSGQAIKKLGTMARKDIEEFLGKKVFLELLVKVDKDWRNNKKELRNFGYKPE